MEIYLERIELKSEFHFFHKFKIGFEMLDFYKLCSASRQKEKKKSKNLQ
jgi:hypothetical protein